MTDKKVTVEMDVRSAAAVRQALFDAQSGFTYNPVCVPERITNIRNVIENLDTEIEQALNWPCGVFFYK